MTTPQALPKHGVVKQVRKMQACECAIETLLDCSTCFDLQRSAEATFAAKGRLSAGVWTFVTLRNQLETCLSKHMVVAYSHNAATSPRRFSRGWETYAFTSPNTDSTYITNFYAKIIRAIFLFRWTTSYSDSIFAFIFSSYSPPGSSSAIADASASSLEEVVLSIYSFSCIGIFGGFFICAT